MSEEESVKQPEDCWLLQLMPAELLHEILHALLAAGEKDCQRQLRDVAAWCLTCSAFNDVCDDETRCRLRCLAAYPGLFSLALSPLFGAPNTHYVAPSSASSTSLSSSLSTSSSTSSSSFPSTTTSSTQSGLSSSTSMPSSSQRRGAAEDYYVDGLRPPRLTWRQRFALLPHLPQRIALCASEREAAHAAQAAHAVVGGGLLKRIFRKEEDSCSAEHDEVVFTVDAKSGRHHTNTTGLHNNLLADHPFLSTNEAALLRVFDGDGGACGIDAASGVDGSDAAGAGDEVARRRRALFVDSLLYRGVEYFEMVVLNNQVSWNRAVAIAVAQHFDSMSFLGWTSTAIAYHSDDGTIRGGEENEVYRSKIFSTGAIVGCGIDWDAGDLFFVCLGAPNEPAEVHLHRPRLDRLPWYPAIASMSRGDEVKVNFGQEPFVFDLKTFVHKKRAGDLSSLVVHTALL